MAQKHIPGTAVPVSGPQWAIGIAMVVVVFAGQLGSILSAVADYQAARDGCVKVAQAIFGGQ